jgi:hypothetical protein
MESSSGTCTTFEAKEAHRVVPVIPSTVYIRSEINDDEDDIIRDGSSVKNAISVGSFTMKDVQDMFPYCAFSIHLCRIIIIFKLSFKRLRKERFEFS